MCTLFSFVSIENVAEYKLAYGLYMLENREIVFKLKYKE